MNPYTTFMIMSKELFCTITFDVSYKGKGVIQTIYIDQCQIYFIIK